MVTNETLPTHSGCRARSSSPDEERRTLPEQKVLAVVRLAESGNRQGLVTGARTNNLVTGLEQGNDNVGSNKRVGASYESASHFEE